MHAHRLGRDVFLALAAVGWSDGKLDAEEADAIVRTALEEGLELDEIEEIEAATRSPIGLGIIDRAELSKADRLFIYAVASWMIRLDGVVDDRELDALRRLGDMLMLPDRPREHADIIALEIAELPEGDRPARYEISRLRDTINERLALAQRMRALKGHRLGRDVFMALAAVAWSDGKVDAARGRRDRPRRARGGPRPGRDCGARGRHPPAGRPVDHRPVPAHEGRSPLRLRGGFVDDPHRRGGRRARARRSPQARRPAEDPRGAARARGRHRPRDRRGVGGRSALRYDLPLLRDTLVERLAEAQGLRAAADQEEILRHDQLPQNDD